MSGKKLIYEYESRDTVLIRYATVSVAVVGLVTWRIALELATHIGEVVINECFCSCRNPIGISAAAIYLACQLEDKCKSQAEICKVTGLTDVTLRKV
ncbi:hypothetical protein DITRI_Ditri16bG0022900 [Diplodiscus trichospermus]